MNNNFKLDTSYIAGLFDAKGTISKRNKVWKMEMSMTDKNVMELVHETLGCGVLKERKFNTVPTHYKKQWRWQCSHRDTLYVCKLLWPHTIIKLHKIEQVIDHYEPDIQDLGDNVVDLALERETRQS